MDGRRTGRVERRRSRSPGVPWPGRRRLVGEPLSPRRRGQLHRDIVVVLGRLLQAVGLPDGTPEQALAVGHAARELVDLLESCSGAFDES